MTFNLIALFSSGLVSQQQAEAASHANTALRRPEAALFGEEKDDEDNAANHPSENDVPQQSPNLRALWSQPVQPKECVKVHTTTRGPLTLKIVRKINGREQGTPVKCTSQDEVYCANGKITRVDVWSGSKDGEWQGTIYTNVNNGQYTQMTPTQKWNPHWMAGRPCNSSSPIAVTGTYNLTCQVCTCQRTGSGRICSLIPQGAPARKCIVPNKGNFNGPSWPPRPAAYVAPRPSPVFRPRPTCPKNKPTGARCRTNCECIRVCSTKKACFFIFCSGPSWKCC